MPDGNVQFTPLNGGCDSESGDLVLLFHSTQGQRIRLQIPFDQSLLTYEIFKRAVSQAAGHAKNELPHTLEPHAVNLRAYEAKELVLAEDLVTSAPILTVRSTEQLQVTFKIDQKIFEQAGLGRGKLRSLEVSGPFATVASDIDYFQRIWRTTYVPPSEIELRWSVAALRRLLINGFVGQAWRNCGFEKEPIISAPDALAALRAQGDKPEHVASMIAGGGCIDGVETSVFGLAKTYNSSTGIGPDADEAFAVKNFNFARDARTERGLSEHDAYLRKDMRLSEFLNTPSLIRKGRAISRQNFLQYYAKWGGGVHLDQALGKEPTEEFSLINDMRGKVDVFGMDGLDFELFSIGFLIANSGDLERLKQAIIDSSVSSNKTQQA